MQNTNRYYLYILTILLSFLIVKPTLAVNQSPSAAMIGNYARQLLDIQQWDTMYEAERKKDINYLLGSIGEKSLTNLTIEQKEQVVSMMRSIIINQLIKDKSYFKGYLIEQYSKSFTQDELTKLIEYFNTEVMQMMIKAKIDNKEITADEINLKFTTQNEPDKKITTWFNDSYLNARYSRFQENITPKINQMIYERIKQLLDATFKKIPALVKSVS